MRRNLFYVTKDFSEEYRYLYDAKEEFLRDKFEKIQKKYPELSMRLSKAVFIGASPIGFLMDFMGLGMNWRFPYIFNIQSRKENLYCDFYVRYNKDIEASVKYYLDNKDKYTEFHEELLFVDSEKFYTHEEFLEFVRSFKGFLTNFYVMDNKIGDIARKLVNNENFNYKDSNDFEKVTIFVNKYFRDMNKFKRKEAVEDLKILWNLYSR